MSPLLATFVYAAGIAGLFLLDRNRKVHTSVALWIPVVWMWIACSRPVSFWLSQFGLVNADRSVNLAEEYLDGSPLDRNVLTGLLVVGVVILISRRRQVGRLLQENAPTLIFFSYCALSILWSDFPDVAFKRWTKAIGNVVMVLIVLTERHPTSALKRLLARVGVVMLPLSLLFIKYYPDLGRTYDRWTYTPFYTGVTDNKNGLGTICLILGLGSAWRFFQLFRDPKSTARYKSLVAHGIILALVGWLLWLANSMTSLSCFVMATTLMAATHLRLVARRTVIIHVLVVLMVFCSLYALFLDSGGGMVAALGRNPTLTGRTDLWRSVLKLAGNPILGTGFESFWLGKRLDELWTQIWWHPNEAHNGYLEFYLTLGWFGVGLFAVLIATGYRNAIRMFRRNADTGRIMLAYFVAAVIYNISEAAFKGMDPIWIVFTLATLALPVSQAVRLPSLIRVGSSAQPIECGTEVSQTFRRASHRETTDAF